MVGDEMIRSVCSYQDNGKRCGKVTRARRIHKFCRPHTLAATGSPRPIPHKRKGGEFKPSKPVENMKVVDKKKKK